MALLPVPVPATRSLPTPSQIISVQLCKSRWWQIDFLSVREASLCYVKGLVTVQRVKAKYENAF